ncbi:hypothetical protein BASA81_005229 [Batrachochytrium salamandrivorans]|nr:hypothetical protein BASA81_005229 [Batrachochytrium salamandrivorans]
MIFAYIVIIPALIASVHAAVIPVTLNGQNLSALRKRAGENRQWDEDSLQGSEDDFQEGPPPPSTQFRSADNKKVDKMNERIANNNQRVKAKQDQKTQKRKEKYNWDVMLANVREKIKLEKKSKERSINLKFESKTNSIIRRRQREEKKTNPRQKVLDKLDKEQEEITKDTAIAQGKAASKLDVKLARLEDKIEEQENKMTRVWAIEDRRGDAQEEFRKNELERKKELTVKIARIRAKDKENGINGSVLDRLRRMAKRIKARAESGE